LADNKVASKAPAAMTTIKARKVRSAVLEAAVDASVRLVQA
jgi:hypothetical protein